MDTFTPQFSFSVGYGTLSFVVYILTVCIIQSNPSVFSGSFFTLYKASFLYNLITFANSFVSLRVPQNTCFNCSLAPFFKSHDVSSNFTFPLYAFYGTQITMAYVQYAMTFLISLNRFTMFIWLNRNDANWKLITPIALILVTFVPFLQTHGIFTNKSYYSYSEAIDGFVSFSEFELQPLLSVMVAFMTVSTTLSAILNLGSLFFLSQMAEKIKKADRTLLYVSVFSFCVELFALIDTFLVKFHKEVPLWFSAIVLWIVPYSSDLITMNQPWVLILFSSAMKEQLKQMLGCSDSQQVRIVSVASRQSAISLQPTSNYA